MNCQCRRKPETEKKTSWQAVYHHYRKWSCDGSLAKVWQASIMTIREELDLTYINLDGSHAYMLPFGRARLVSTGTDLTIVTWGAMVERSEMAVRELTAWLM